MLLSPVTQGHINAKTYFMTHYLQVCLRKDGITLKKCIFQLCQNADQRKFSAET